MAPEDSNSDWYDHALNILERQTDPAVKFDVLDRTIRECTDKLEPMRVNGGEEIQVLIARLEGRSPDAAVPVVIDDQGGNVDSVAQLAVGLDQMLFHNDSFLKGQNRRHLDRGITAPNFLIDGEYAEIETFSDHLIGLTQVIDHYFGDDCIDLTLGLLQVYLSESQGKSFLPKKTIQALDAAKKRALVNHLLPKLGQFDEKQVPGIMRWALGTKFMHRLGREIPDVSAQLAKIREIFSTSEHFRTKLLRALRGLRLTPDRLTVSAILRWGWEGIDEVDQVTDHEWWTFVRKQHEFMRTQAEAGDADVVKSLSNTSGKARFELRDRRIREFFERTPNPPDPAEIKKLKDIIGCDKLREELEQFEQEHNPRGYEEKQREILARVSGAISRYVVGNVNTAQDEREPSWKMGTPQAFVQSKNASCFTGPWLIALMLMECGIQYNDLIYAHVNQAHDGQIGGHGGLIMKTRLRHEIFIDHGYNFACRDLPAGMAVSKKDIEQIIGLLNGEIKESVTAQFNRHEMDRVHRHMQLMPLNDGFASGHMYHIGLSFLNEGKLDEAEYAFELALNFNRQDPDILYHMGVLSLERQDIEDAERYFEEALRIFPDHLFSEYGLGICLARRGHFDTAKHHFKVVAESPFSIWQAEHVKKKSAEYAAMDDADLQSALLVI